MNVKEGKIGGRGGEEGRGSTYKLIEGNSVNKLLAHIYICELINWLIMAK